MALKLKFTDEHGILHIDMASSPVDKDITDPKFDTINNRFGQYDLFGAKYGGAEGTNSGEPSLFRSRYNSLEEELANTPYAFAAPSDPILDITIDCKADTDLFGPKIDTAFTITQLIHAQDRYFDLSTRGIGSEVKSAPCSANVRVTRDGAFRVLSHENLNTEDSPRKTLPVVPTSKRKKESSFAIITDAPPSRPSSPRSLPVEIRPGRVSPFKGRGFREETSRHNTPKTSAANSRNNSPPRRTKSLTRIDRMAQATLLPPPSLHKPPRDFLKENMEEIRELSELNREKHEAEAEKRKQEEELALLKEMGIIDKKGEIRSVGNSRTNSRSNSPNKFTLRSRSNSPSAVLLYETIDSGLMGVEDGTGRRVTHNSRVRSVSRSPPQSNNGSPKNSKIPKRQGSVSPARSLTKISIDTSKVKSKQRVMSSSTSNLNETIRIGSQVHDKRTSQSTQQLSLSPSNIKGKPPISPGRGGPPPTNKAINAKRLSPIVGTPSKSPLQDSKPGSAKTPTKPATVTRKPAKTVGSTPATSKLNSKQTSRVASRDASPEKRTATSRTTTKTTNATQKSVNRTGSTKVTQKAPVVNKYDPKKPVSRTNSVKSLTKAPSVKSLNEKPPLNKRNSKKDISEKPKSADLANGAESKKDTKVEDEDVKNNNTEPIKDISSDKAVANTEDSVTTVDNETQYDKVLNDKGEWVILTKKNVVSMTTAAITSQPLEVVATVTNQLPAAFEKAREKGIFERLSSKDSILSHVEENGDKDTKVEIEEKLEKHDKDEKKHKTHDKTIFCEDNVKLKLLQPPYNNPQVEKVKLKIDSILKEPEISTENILAAAKAKEKLLKSATEKAAKSEAKEVKKEAESKIKEIKQDVVKESEKVAAKIISEIPKVDTVIPIETPQEMKQQEKKEIIEPTVTVVNEKKEKEIKAEITEKINETLVQGGPEVEVQSSNLSTPGDKITVQKKDGNGSEKSHSNGGFPQSTSTTPKPPPRNRSAKEQSPPSEPISNEEPRPNICSRLMGKCKSKCCPCCVKGEDDEMEPEVPSEKKTFWSRMKHFEKKVTDEDVERAAGKGSTIEFESEAKRKRKLRDILCGCCRRQRVADISEPPRHLDVSPPVTSSDVVQETGCCGKKRQAERRDSILSEPPNMCCNNRLGRWFRGACRRQSEQSSSRRTSMFSKNKSLSPTLPPEDTRKKLEPSLVEHTSAMRGAIPVLPTVLAYFCLVCNVLIPGLGTILSGLFCLCFGIPRFGVHDGAKYRIGSFFINMVMGVGQLFTVLFCLVGWGWSIWWGVIMVRISRKYRKLKREAEAEEAEAPPVTANNHTRA